MIRRRIITTILNKFLILLLIYSLFSIDNITTSTRPNIYVLTGAANIFNCTWFNTDNLTESVPLTYITQVFISIHNETGIVIESNFDQDHRVSLCFDN